MADPRVELLFQHPATYGIEIEHREPRNDNQEEEVRNCVYLMPSAACWRYPGGIGAPGPLCWGPRHREAEGDVEKYITALMRPE